MMSTLEAAEPSNAARIDFKTFARNDGATALPSWPQSALLLSGSFIGLMYFMLIPSLVQWESTVLIYFENGFILDFVMF